MGPLLRFGLAAAVFLLACPAARADVLYAGKSVFEGKVSAEQDGSVKVQAGKRSLSFKGNQVTAIEKSAVPPGGTRRFRFGLDHAYYLHGELEYLVTFQVQDVSSFAGGDSGAFSDWSPWLKGFVNVTNDTDRNVYLYIAVALFDKEGKLLGASSHPWWEESILEPKGGSVINLDFGLAGYGPADVDHFLITLRDGVEPQLPPPPRKDE